MPDIASELTHRRRHPELLGYLPPHLRELCTLLASGLVRLRRHTAAEPDDDDAIDGGPRESSLHFVAHQSGHAKPKHRRQA